MRHLQERMKSELTKDSERRCELFEQTPGEIVVAGRLRLYITTRRGEHQNEFQEWF